MSFSCPELNLDEILSLAKRFRYDGIEPRIDSGHKHDVELDANAAARREIKRKVSDSGIAICCVATSCTYADPATTQQKIDQTRRCIDLAADVGTQRLRVFGGKIPEGISREKAIEVAAESLRSVANHADERGVIVCMETHDDWCNPEHVAEVMKRVDHPAIAVNWDVMHPVRVALATMDQAFATLKPWIRHLHVHDGSLKGDELLPIGQGDFDHRRAIELLLSISYDGCISGEWIDWKDPYEVHLPRELATLKHYEQEAKRTI